MEQTSNHTNDETIENRKKTVGEERLKEGKRKIERREDENKTNEKLTLENKKKRWLKVLLETQIFKLEQIERKYYRV